MVSSLAVPVPADVIARLGGASAWAPADHPRIGRALHAFAVGSPDAVGDTLRALASLTQDIEPARQGRLTRVGVEYMRWAYRRVPAAQWEGTLRIAVAGLELFRAAVSASRLGDAGARDVDLFASAADPLAGGSARALADRSDTDVFLAFLGAEGARRRPAEWEIRARADVLVAEVFRRIGAHADGDDAAEGIHWSLALLDRIRRREVEMQFLLLAVRLLRLAARSEAGHVLRSYIQRYPSVVPWLFDHNELRELLERADLVELYVEALDASLLDAAKNAETGGVVALAGRLREAGLALTEPELRRGLEGALARTTPELARADRADGGLRLPALRAALTPIVARDAVPALDALLRSEPAHAAVEEPAQAWRPDDGVEHAGHHVSRGRLALLGGTSIAVLALTVTFAQRWATPGVDASLAEARGWASMNEHGRVVELLSAKAPEPAAREAFAWDSLLARSAFQQAARLPAQDAGRRELFALTWTRADRALATVAPFAPGTDVLRLLRAEACIEGDLTCDSATIMQDLLFAARSASVGVSRRANALLASRAR
jgi:hypothetical protein